MGRIYADIPGFKKLDASLRELSSAYLAALKEVDRCRARKLKPDELAAMDAVEASLNDALADAKKARAVLWDGVVSVR